MLTLVVNVCCCDGFRGIREFLYPRLNGRTLLPLFLGNKVTFPDTLLIVLCVWKALSRRVLVWAWTRPPVLSLWISSSHVWLHLTATKSPQRKTLDAASARYPSRCLAPSSSIVPNAIPHHTVPRTAKLPTGHSIKLFANARITFSSSVSAQRRSRIRQWRAHYPALHLQALPTSTWLSRLLLDGLDNTPTTFRSWIQNVPITLKMTRSLRWHVC